MSGRATPAYEQASVLFSGGTDSALAAVEMLKLAQRVTLLTFDPGYIFFVDNSRVHAETLAERFGAERVHHVIEPIGEPIRRILFSQPKRDLRKYAFDMTALVCMGCRLSMHAAAVAYNLEHGIPLLADGSIRKQDAIPEQRQAVLDSNRERYLREFGIRHVSPIYDVSNSDERLFEAGVAPKRGLKKQFIFFDTQATCVFGVPADVYARMFYKPLMGQRSTDIQAVEYCRERDPLVRQVVVDLLERKGLDVETQAQRLREMHVRAEEAGHRAARAEEAERGATRANDRDHGATRANDRDHGATS